jgi:multidrug resistance efflux pump
VTNLSLRPGDYAKAGVPIVGIVDDTQWRVVGNFKEYTAAGLKPGARAWIWLDSHPWRLFPARVFGSDAASSATKTSSAFYPMWRRRPTGFACRVGCR